MVAPPKLRVLICDDSAGARALLAELLRRDGRFEVVGQAADGVDAVYQCRELAPDVVAMDIQMPRMTGLEATAAIMATCPTPVVVVSSRVEFEAELSRTNGLGAGAVAVVEKPRAPGLPQFERMAREVTDALAAMAGLKVVRIPQRRSAGEGRAARREPYRVVICDDSRTARAALAAALSADPEIEVVGQACDGGEAVELVRRLRPDVVTMDVEMPSMHGYEAARRIMAERRTPIVIVSASASALSQDGLDRGRDSGALAVLPRPALAADGDAPQIRALRETVKRSARFRFSPR